ncbi:MAG TPA: OmpA family protein [Mycobacterium sp.]|uniref:channel-forming protein ArfA/OmpATb n=1 Tax=Mycolicibacterium sp. TaxID=2320850 RepID=UPI0025E79819|nr:OmpA family protein [Mycolicibacterium sp.]HPX35773.1 OmpA family protein [Mycobacterium sp.]HQC76506.1 OmpA family protein [Mycobacterium sp.]
MTGSGEKRVTASATEWRTESRYYRRSPGLGWLAGLALIPLLFGWLGSGVLKPKVDISAPNVNVSAPNVSLPSLNFSPLSILRSGKDFILSGILPDLGVKDKLLGLLKAALPGVNLIDKIDIAAGANAPDFSGLGALLKAAIDIPDFRYTVNGGKLTLIGTAPSEEVKAAVEAAAKAGWPNLEVINDMIVKGGAVSCDNLQSVIDSDLASPLKFETDSANLSADGQAELAPVVEAVKACSGVKLTVVGHTDNTGNDAINNPLSESRAKSVADYLVAQGVAADSVSSKGAGSSEPVASNDTEAGRAENRRTEIKVS